MTQYLWPILVYSVQVNVSFSSTKYIQVCILHIHSAVNSYADTRLDTQTTKRRLPRGQHNHMMLDAIEHDARVFNHYFSHGQIDHVVTSQRHLPVSVSYTHLDVYKRQGVYQQHFMF